MRVYEKKGPPREWDDISLNLALRDMKEKEVSIAKAAEAHKVPEKTLRRRWKIVLDKVGLNDLPVVNYYCHMTTVLNYVL